MLVIHLCVRGIDFASFNDFSIGVGTVPIVWYYLFFLSLFIACTCRIFIEFEDYLMCILLIFP